eukprot:c16037_g1_i1 orf=586-1368(-)
MATDDEDDYMGDLSRFVQPHDLLPSPVQTPSVDTSGLSKQQKKKLKLVQQQKREDQHRLEGLGSAISSSNKGFKMLQQMGYKPGAALGKHGQGSLEPINVDVKRSRSGLGRDHLEKAQEQFKARISEFKRDMAKKKQAELKTGFQERRKGSWQARKLISDYRKAQTALQHLEEAQLSTTHGGSDKEDVLGHLEPKNLDDNEEEGLDNSDEDSEEEIELQDLQELLQRLRSEYFYCLYCGCQYETAGALLANCPGLEEEDH